jgi:hypothetical protein
MRINEISPGEKVSFRQDTSSSSNAPPDIEEIKSVLKVVAENCSEVIHAMKQTKKVLYRGIATKDGIATPIAFHGMSRENRRPVSTKSKVDDALNQGLANSGMVALRNNSIFVSTHASTAASYGNLYLIFPKDGFHYTWNMYYEDFFSDFIYDSIQYNRSSSAGLEEEKFFSLAKTSDFAKEYGFTDMNFEEAMRTNHEIMVSGEYYALYSADFRQHVSMLF